MPTFSKSSKLNVRQLALSDILVWSCRRLVINILRSQTFQIIGVSLRQIPTPHEVVERSKILCEDFIYDRLQQPAPVVGRPALPRRRPTLDEDDDEEIAEPAEEEGEMMDEGQQAAEAEDAEAAVAENPGAVPEASTSKEEDASASTTSSPTWEHDAAHSYGDECCHLTDTGKELRRLGAMLESINPTLFVDLSYQLSMPLRSAVSARKALISIGDFMFHNESSLSWPRIVSFFNIAAAVARECVQHNHPEHISAIVTVFAEIVEKHLALWICRQGGWVRGLLYLLSVVCLSD